MIHIYILIFLQIFPTKKKNSVSEWVSDCVNVWISKLNKT